MKKKYKSVRCRLRGQQRRRRTRKEGETTLRQTLLSSSFSLISLSPFAAKRGEAKCSTYILYSVIRRWGDRRRSKRRERDSVELSRKRASLPSCTADSRATAFDRGTSWATWELVSDKAPTCCRTEDEGGVAESTKKGRQQVLLLPLEPAPSQLSALA